MPLFEVPGWIVPTTVMNENSDLRSKKRKRPTGDSNKFQSSEINLEQLVKRLTRRSPTNARSTSSRKQERPFRGSKSPEKWSTKDDIAEQKKLISRPRPLKPAVIGKDSTECFQPVKRRKTKHGDSTSDLSRKSGNNSATSLTALQFGMRQSLDGARFRIINENLYKTDSRQAHEMMKADPQVFQDYHAGFRRQVEMWPTNPVQHYIEILSELPPKTVVADLGCGDAALARSLIQKGMSVLSFDLVSEGAFVIEADICNQIPLPGSEGPTVEKSDGEGQIVDVAVCALSLMSTNWPNCLREAWRILKSGGELKIAEVTSRITNVDEFQNLVRLIGFHIQSKDESNSHFTLFSFKKKPRRRKNEKEWAKILASASILKPCEYKRR